MLPRTPLARTPPSSPIGPRTRSATKTAHLDAAAHYSRLGQLGRDIAAESYFSSPRLPPQPPSVHFDSASRGLASEEAKEPSVQDLVMAMA